MQVQDTSCLLRCLHFELPGNCPKATGLHCCHSSCRQDAVLGEAELDQQLRSLHVPEWAITHSGGNKWKWCDVGMAPFMHARAPAKVQTLKEAVSAFDHGIAAAAAAPAPAAPASTTTADLDGSAIHREKQAPILSATVHKSAHSHYSHELSRQIDRAQPLSDPYQPHHPLNLTVRAAWRSPSRRSPSPPAASFVPADITLRSASPSVARACVTLPGFLPSVGLCDATDIHAEAKQHVTLCPPTQQCERGDKSNVVQQQHLSTQQSPAQGHALGANGPAMPLPMNKEPSNVSFHQPKQEQVRDVMLQYDQMPAQGEGSMSSWIGTAALPKVSYTGHDRAASRPLP